MTVLTALVGAGVLKPRAVDVSIWLVSGAGSCVVAVVAWAVASHLPTSQPLTRTTDEVPILVTLAAAAHPPEEGDDEPSWEEDSVALPVELDVALSARFDDATPLPFEHEADGFHFRRSGRHYLRSPGAVDIVVGKTNGFSGDRIELRLRQAPDGTFQCQGLVTEFVDVGPPFSHTVPNVTGRVRLSSFDWEHEGTIVLTYELTSNERQAPRTGLLNFNGH